MKWIIAAVLFVLGLLFVIVGNILFNLIGAALVFASGILVAAGIGGELGLESEP